MATTAFTTMSQNGQIVIPREMRKEFRLRPKTRFLIVGAKGQFLLKPVDEALFRKEFALLEKLTRIKEDVKKGAYTSVPNEATDEQAYELLTGKPWNSSTVKRSKKSSIASHTRSQ